MDGGADFETLSPPNEDPFWATRLWQQLITHVQLHVRTGRHRHLLKQYSSVFVGSDLVDEVFIFLKNYPTNVMAQHITRKNAIKVCHVLMENKVFESVVPRELQKFEDGSSRLYRFLEEDTVNLSSGSSPETSTEKENKRLWLSSPSLSTSTSQFAAFCKVSSKETDTFENRSSSRGILQERNIISSAASRISIRKRKHKTDKVEPDCPSLLFENQWTNSEQFHKTKTWQQNLRRSFSHSSLRKIVTPMVTKQFPSSSNVSHDECMSLREVALAHLLSLVDIPVLESILSVPWDMPQTTSVCHPLVIENDPHGISKADSITFLDVIGIPWVQAAILCLPKYPSGINSLWSVQACKIHCYQSVVDCYSSVTESIIPENFLSICTAVIELLKQGKRKYAFCALQLMIIFLPRERRVQLKNLLPFLLLVIEDIFVKVDKKMTNYDAVSRDFMNTVFNHPLVAKEHCQVLFDFMTFKASSLFDIPSFLQHSNLPGPRFCEGVPMEDFGPATIKYTSESLQNLVFSVMDCPRMPLKEKKSWLKKFAKVYPGLYSSCLPE